MGLNFQAKKGVVDVLVLPQKIQKSKNFFQILIPF